MAICLVYSTSGITSGKKVCRDLKMAAILKILKYSIWIQIWKDRSISEMLMVILLTYSTSGITFGKKVCCDLKMEAILKILKHQTQLQFDLRYEKIVPNCAK